MLKNNKNSKTIVSRLFDTISGEQDACETDTSVADTSVADTSVSDTSVADTSVADTSRADTSRAANASTADTSRAANASTADTSVADASTSKYIVSVPTMQRVMNKKPFLICTYQVRTDGLYPFLMFLFKKNNNEATATFIQMENHKKINYAAMSHMHDILPRATLAYAGFCETAENNILILSANDETTAINDDYRWATSFEIINKKKIMNYLIEPAVIAFFLSNPDFLILKTVEHRIYESPMVGYKSHENTCAEEEMDIYRETIIPTLGKCYYINRDIPADSECNTIMRIAFFAGKMVLNKEKSYDSLLCNTENCNYYIIQNYNHHSVLF
jgi:hypothetical protein